MQIFFRFSMVLMVVVGAAMVVGAWFSIGHVAGEAVVDLALLGILLPTSMYALLTIIRWQQQVKAGVPLGGFAAWCTRHQVNKTVPLVVMGLLLGMAHSLTGALDRSGRSPAAADATDEMDALSFDRNMRQGCFTSAARTMKVSQSDPSSAGLRSKIQDYCGCMATRLEAAYPLPELIRLTLDGAPGLKDPKYTGIIKACASASFQ